MKTFFALGFLSLATATAFAADMSCDACRIALAPNEGSSSLDQQIVKAQDAVRKAADPRISLEKLGWLFVSKARTSYDAGYYKLAEQCAQCLEKVEPGSLDAELLRAHVLQSLHRFHDAEIAARDLVKRRGLPFDYGVLGDALIDQGNVSDAADAYQKMMDLKPDLQSYLRAGQVRWLMGDLDGAIEAADMAARAGSPNDPESAAWAYTRYAIYTLQAGRIADARDACDIAIKLLPDCAPALLMRGKILLSQNKAAAAVTQLQQAAELNPLPEYQWALADALRADGKTNEAAGIETTLSKRGAAEDPRSFALFLATRGLNTGRALQLAEKELDTRKDIFSFDAVAWALHAAGRNADAADPMQRALAEGTQDARLFFHAGVIALETGNPDKAREWFDKAAAMQQTLLPSERDELGKQMAGLDGSSSGIVR